MCCAEKWQTPDLKARLDNCSKIMGAEVKRQPSPAAERSSVTASPVPGLARVFCVRPMCWLVAAVEQESKMVTTLQAACPRALAHSVSLLYVKHCFVGTSLNRC